jgi:protein prenyltransferase alpha subunit repeat containing protein 1
MSRALDKGVKEALKKGDHVKIFRELSGVLSQKHDQLLEIELLPPSHELPRDAIFLQDGNAIAVPKLQLVQAFTVARQGLKKLDKAQSFDDPEALLSLSGVMLLMDPEHLTAANTRKRILDGVYHRDEDRGKHLLLREKYLIDSLLTSRLHRHTKSPTLWSHRRWLCGRLLGAGLSIDMAQELRDVIFVSAERHPRNYYAWCHARLVLDLAGELDTAQMDILVEDTKKWCFGHRSDISGWTFLQFLLERCHEGVLLSVFRDTLELVESFRWRNESVWCFLRTVSTWATMKESGRAELHRVLALVRGEGEEEDKTARVFDYTDRWLELYSPETRG